MAQQRHTCQPGEDRALLAGELDWKQYIKPAADKVTDLDACLRIDQLNEGIYEYNNAMLPRINELLKKMGAMSQKLNPAPRYAHTARQKILERMYTDEYRMLACVEFLYARGKHAVRDYKLIDGPRLADDIARDEEIARQVSAGPVDITDAVGRAHTKTCTCGLRWDGTSERCMGMGARLRWVVQPTHHFERPNVKPETF